MTSPRDRRLEAEYAAMQELAQSSSLIEFTSRGSPPSQYNVTLSCRGLVRYGERISGLSHHEFTFILGNSFPLDPPDIVWKTPIFHPNIKPPLVCTGDIWYPKLTLADLCTSLCELVQYKSFNAYHALDHDAADWLVAQVLSEHLDIPVDRRPVRDADFDLEFHPQGDLE